MNDIYPECLEKVLENLGISEENLSETVDLLTFPSASMFLKNFVLTGEYLFSLLASLSSGFLMKKISKRNS